MVDYKAIFKREPLDPLKVLDMYSRVYDQMERYWDIKTKYPNKGHVILLNFLKTSLVDRAPTGKENEVSDLVQEIDSKEKDIKNVIESLEARLKYQRKKIINDLSDAENCLMKYLSQQGVDFTQWDPKLGRAQLITNALYQDNKFSFIRNIRQTVVARTPTYINHRVI